MVDGPKSSLANTNNKKEEKRGVELQEDDQLLY